MVEVLAVVCAFLVASSLAWNEVAGRPDSPLEFYFLRKCHSYWCYGAFYGLVAVLVLIALGLQPGSGSFDIAGISITSPIS